MFAIFFILSILPSFLRQPNILFKGFVVTVIFLKGNATVTLRFPYKF